MTRDDIIRMARQVGYPIQHEEWRKATEEFAALVAAAEREACAQRLDAVGCDHCATNIRARGQA